ncbi:ABC transporter substrate-binding protein [Alkalihalobacillus pseudalcaliphilus]|nr:ABC transporter substrate-binding protein [Alkalihalobacillus pseudalcaliphilus]
MKWSKIGLTAVLSVGLLAACGTADDNNQGSGETEVDENAETLVMGTSADYPPFESVDITTGEYVGLDIDIAKHITSELGYNLKIENMDFSTLQPSLQSDRIDFAISAMNATPDRKENLDFSTEYYDAINEMVFLEEDGYTTLEELEGLTIGVQLGSIQQDAAEELGEEYGFEVKPFDRIPETVQELQTGRIAGILMENSVAADYTERQDTLASFAIDTEDQGGYAIAFNKGSDLVEEFNEVLDEMIESGLLEELINEWVRDVE